MGNAGAQEPCLQPQCRFPTSARKQEVEEHYGYESIRVFSDANLAEHWKGESEDSKRALFLSAWAVVLRRYVGDERVSFALISDHAPVGFDQEEGGGLETDDASDVDFEARILCFRVDDASPLGDICSVLENTYGLEGARDAGVNTAIHLSTSWDDESGVEDDTRRTLKMKRKENVLRHHFDIIFDGITLNYLRPKVSPKYARIIANTFQETLGQCLYNSNLRVDQLLLINSSSAILAQSWNPRDPMSVTSHECMHHLVNAQARDTPDAEAVCSWDGSLTYSELDALASVAAQRLVNSGVGPSMYVPFMYEKSKWAVVAMLAILKAGGAFVPLNRYEPPARLAQILQGVDARVVVTSEECAGGLAGMVKEVVVISGVTMNKSDLAAEALAPAATAATVQDLWPSDPRNPIFVLFTSGSTGTAKGMIHSHQSICTHALSHGRAMGYHNARVLQFAAYTFDVAIIDIFTTLLFGGCICVPSEEERRTSIIEVIHSTRADYAILTPSFAGLIDPSDVPTLKTLAVGGEALPQERIDRWADKVRLIQIYGPAEVGICLTMDMERSTRPETVGRPLDNSSCWLVDPEDSDRLVPIGAVGELVVAGPSLAQGYLNDAARTAQAFIGTPAWAQPLELSCGSRFYRTGDLLRYNVAELDGTMDFVGRKDAQIKLRGQRVEPGEVEYHIGHIPGVAVCMTIRPEDGCFRGELVAVVQLHDQRNASIRIRSDPLSLAPVQSLCVADARERLERVLPGYMIPSTYLVVQCMPYVPSLKVDRKRVERWLMDMKTRPLETSLNLLAPLDSREKTAITISTKVAEYIAPKDKLQASRLKGHNFLLQEVGIDSIQIISLSMFLRKTYKTRIPMELLLSAKLTIRELASLVDASSLPSTNGHHPPRSALHSAQIDIREEAAFLYQQLIPSVESSPRHRIASRTRAPVRNVLVTGGTGYLGTAILHQLLAIPKLHIYLLIRCADPVSGLERVRRDLKTHNCWQEETHPQRIHVWPGDITLPNLGLKPPELRQFLGNDIGADLAIHALIHNGARVHYSSSYEMLESCNVTATLEALRLAAQAAYLHSFVFVSGGVSPSFDLFSPSSSSSSADRVAHLNGATGYTQTKQVAEMVVRRCMQDSEMFRAQLPPSMRIVKPGYIIGSSRNGIANRSDFIWRLVAGCMEIGAYNGDDAGRWLFVADVERVARDVVAGIGELARAEDEDPAGVLGSEGLVEPQNAILGVPTGLRLSALWALLAQTHNYRLTPLPHAIWLSRLLARVLGVGETHVLYPLLHILERDEGRVGEEVGEEMEGVVATEGVEEAVAKNVEYLIREGFLPEARGRDGDVDC